MHVAFAVRAIASKSGMRLGSALGSALGTIEFLLLTITLPSGRYPLSLNSIKKMKENR